VSISDRDEVYTADIRGRVYKYGSDGLTFVGNTDRIADFTVADVAGQTTVAAVVDSSPCRLAILSEANGKLSYILVGASTFPCSAIALGNRRSMLYVGRLNDIYAVSIPNYRPKFLTSFRRTDAGPLVTDDQSRRIFVGDDSRIFAVSYDGGGSRTFARDLGRIRSLAVDASRRRLYAGDINGRRVWQLSLAEDKSPPVEFLNRQSVSTPLGLGIDSKGTVWVGDKDKRALLAFSPDGKLLQTISAK
jgi:hypothetical protein